MVAHCPKCGTQVRVDDKLTGAQLRCSKCGASFGAPGATGEIDLDLELDFDLAPEENAVPTPQPLDASAFDTGAIDLGAPEDDFAPASLAVPPMASPAPAPAPTRGAAAQAAQRATAPLTRPVPSLEDDLLLDADVIDAGGPLAHESTAPTAPGGEPVRAETRVIAIPNLTPQPAEKSKGGISAALKLVGRGRATAAHAPLQAPAPAPLAAAAVTRVGPPPRDPLAAPAFDGSGLPAAEDDFMMSGGLSADGTLVGPDSGQSEPPADPPQQQYGESVTRDVRAPDIAKLLKGGDIAATGAYPAPALTASPSPGSTRGIVGRTAGAFVGALLLLLGVLVFLADGRLDRRIFTLPESGAHREPAPVDGVHITRMRSVLYPTAGGNALVFVGEAQNRASEASGLLEVVAEVRDRGGRVLASERAPLGLALGPAELSTVLASTDLDELYARKGKPGHLPPGSSAPYTVVLRNPPASLHKLRHEISLAEAPEPSTTVLPPPQAEPPPPPPPVEEAPLPSKRKGKAKGKAKAALRDAPTP